MKIAYYALMFVLGLLVGGVIVMVRMAPEPAIPGTLAPELAKAAPVVETLPVKSYPGVNKKLGVPKEEKVLTSVKLDLRTNPQTITAALDGEGQTTLYIRNDPLPWFGKQKKHDLSLIAGVMDGDSVYRLQYRYDLYQIKRVNLGLAAGTNVGGSGERRALVGVSLSYSW